MYASTIISILQITAFFILIQKFPTYPNRVFRKSTLLIVEVIALLTFVFIATGLNNQYLYYHKSMYLFHVSEFNAVYLGAFAYIRCKSIWKTGLVIILGILPFVCILPILWLLFTKSNNATTPILTPVESIPTIPSVEPTEPTISIESSKPFYKRLSFRAFRINQIGILYILIIILIGLSIHQSNQINALRDDIDSVEHNVAPLYTTTSEINETLEKLSRDMDSIKSEIEDVKDSSTQTYSPTYIPTYYPEYYTY